MQDTASIQPTYKPQKSNALRRADKHRSDLYKSSILHYCPSLIGQIYLTRLRPQQPTPSPSADPGRPYMQSPPAPPSSHSVRVAMSKLLLLDSTLMSQRVVH